MNFALTSKIFFLRRSLLRDADDAGGRVVTADRALGGEVGPPHLLTDDVREDEADTDDENLARGELPHVLERFHGLSIPLRLRTLH